MTQELRTQRDDLMRARDIIDSRRRFTEAVLAGASAGVIGVDPEGRISILNRSAEKLIGQGEADVMGRALGEVMPELGPLFAEAARACIAGAGPILSRTSRSATSRFASTTAQPPTRRRYW